MIRERLNQLRGMMKTHDIQAYLVPNADPHQSEYVPGLWQRRRWLTGFDGSAGDAVVTMEEAGLWTDSRYFLQAEQQLQGSGIGLYKIGVPGTPDIPEFLAQRLKADDRVGIDPRVFTHTDADRFAATLAKKKIRLVFIEENLVDTIWEDRPALPEGKAMIWPDSYAGESAASKIDRLRDLMKEENADLLVLSALDQIAWTFNIRGTDVEYNPVVISYAILLRDEARLYLSPGKLDADIRKELEAVVRIYPYDAFADHLHALAGKNLNAWIDSNTVSRWIVDLQHGAGERILKQSPVTPMKARKNETELRGFRSCHVRDGVAMVKFLHWLEQAVPQGGVTEISAADRLLRFREEQDLFRGQSFAPIAAYRDHGAIVHYSSTPVSDVPLYPEGLFLIDSGGQYLDGTTDITRTVALGPPDDEQKDRFTRVLRGHIDLALTRFPEGTTGIQLDTIARKALWDVGLNYGHGTGHGLGVFLNVHEGPHAISYYRGIGVALEPGMITSNEPGFYKPGEYGIRIENLMEVIIDESISGDQKFYTFATATLCPIDLSLVKVSLLTEVERNYLNRYHDRVRITLWPLLEDKDRVWLADATQPV